MQWDPIEKGFRECAQYDGDCYGRDSAVPETLEASLQIGAIAMVSIGIGPGEIGRILEEFRNEDYADLDATVQSDAGA